MDALVVQQEPVVDVIDQRAEETQQNVVHGSGALDNAIKSAKNRNKWKWYCLLIVGKTCPSESLAFIELTVL